MTNLEIKVARYHCSGKPVAVIALNGIWDSFARSELEQTTQDLLAENIVHYVFDLSEVTGAESTGIGFLIKLVTEVQGRFGSVVVIGASARLKTAGDMVGLWGYVSLANNLEHALKLV